MADRLKKGGSRALREQEDAQEFLLFLLTRSHEELLKLKKLHGSFVEGKLSAGPLC